MMIDLLNTKPESLTHDGLIIAILELGKVINKKKVTNYFLSSLSAQKKSWRSGLSSLAMIQTLPKHSYKINGDVTDSINCKICGDEKINTLDWERAQFGFNTNLMTTKLIRLYYCLYQYNLLEDIAPTVLDFDIFRKILSIINETEDSDTLKKKVLSKVGKIKGFKSVAEERMHLMETLGYCSILETEKHKGFLNHYTSLGHAPRSSHSSDWRYPVDFWNGKDGINYEALEFWFGSYPELAQCFPEIKK